jgi:hypothetical protein
MRYLSGCVRLDLPSEVGVILTPMMGNRLPPDRVWAADNGMFAQPAAFDPVAYLGWLAAYQGEVDRCLFATAPDVVGDAAATLARSRPFLPILRALGFPAALVAQDGLESLPVPWDAVDCLFIGGTTSWKLSEAAYTLMAEAKRRHKWVHAGRVNSLRRLRAMAIAGADSADGTFLKFGPDVNLPRMARWLQVIREQPPLFTTG